ncbi:hypothetical protein K8I61_00030 [bacterium]|nr:hypothetical protein [bacterium]
MANPGEDDVDDDGASSDVDDDATDDDATNDDALDDDVADDDASDDDAIDDDDTLDDDAVDDDMDDDDTDDDFDDEMCGTRVGDEWPAICLDAHDCADDCGAALWLLYCHAGFPIMEGGYLYTQAEALAACRAGGDPLWSDITECADGVYELSGTVQETTYYPVDHLAMCMSDFGWPPEREDLFDIVAWELFYNGVIDDVLPSYSALNLSSKVFWDPYELWLGIGVSIAITGGTPSDLRGGLHLWGSSKFWSRATYGFGDLAYRDAALMQFPVSGFELFIPDPWNEGTVDVYMDVLELVPSTTP